MMNAASLSTRKRPFILGALLMIASSVVGFSTSPVQSASIQQPVDQIHNANKQKNRETCRSCHEQVDHPQLPQLFTEECASCHGGGDSKTEREFMEMAVQPAREESQRDIQQDLSLPLYYEKSRLGAKPNTMIEIPAGKFIMGTNNRLPDEGPEHEVELATYWIDKYEVTNLQYKHFMDETSHRSPKLFENRTFPPGKADHPVTYVTWKDATEYCAWAGKRLPTDAEWEKAARGNDGQIFPWGDSFDVHKANTPQRWMYLDHEGDTTPVGAFESSVSPYGLYDMSGNVWEWTSSWYKAYPNSSDESENYGETYKTLKGGSWWDCSFYKCGISAPLYNRSFFLPGTKNKSFGFRCANDTNQS